MVKSSEKQVTVNGYDRSDSYILCFLKQYLFFEIVDPIEVEILYFLFFVVTKQVVY